MKKIFVKEFERAYSLFQVVAYTEFNERLIPGFNVKVDIGHPLFVFSEGPLIKVYYSEGEIKKIFNQFGMIASNVDYFNVVVSKFFDVVAEITPYFEKKKSVKNIEELKYLYELYLDFCYGESAVWVAPLIEDLNKELKERALFIREKTQHLTSLRDELFDYNLNKLFPELKDLSHFVLPESIFSNKSINEILKEAAEYQKEFIYFEGNIYKGQQDKILKDLNIELEEGIPTGEINFINGQSASQGIVKGQVKIVLTNKDLHKVLTGDILVSPMTKPDFIPAMNRASAFVTDEGGITCHAAIVARELNKPCLIGTKIATKVLKDGDIIEVDANKGVIKIIK